MDTPEMISTEQQKQIRSLLMKVNGFSKKEEWVGGRTGGRTTQTHEMLAGEAMQMIAWLEDRDGSMNRMRRKVISLAHQLGWKDARDPEGKRADYARINNWMVTYTACKKPMARQSAEELKTSLDQFEAFWGKEVRK